ncbi:hypothetical protein [Actinomadura litoris]|uniref:hypothetical protein n=1 Tax=Actinomadura litoris TaxID=2678616 RepID=UPI001FA708E4|nr:hypothetical protein [Actinomadura litoris]
MIVPNPWTALWFTPQRPEPVDDRYQIDGKYEFIGDAEAFIVADIKTREIVGAAHSDDVSSGWWNCTIHGRVCKLFVPRTVAEPHLDVARRLTR